MRLDEIETRKYYHVTPTKNEEVIFKEGFEHVIMDIRKIATRVRSEELDFHSDDNPTLQALCLDVSRRLRDSLIDEGYQNSMVVQGNFAVDEPYFFDDEDEDEFIELYELLHYWVEVRGLVVDITQTQFEDFVTQDELEDVYVDKVESAYKYRYVPLRKGWR